MGSLTQDNRFLKVSDFGLGQDTFLLTELSGDEFISEAYTFKLKLLSSQLDIRATDIVGKPVSFQVCKPDNDNHRYFHGYARQFVQGESEAADTRSYHLEVVPWIAFLQQTRNQRIFQDKTTQEIISTILRDYGYNDFEFSLSNQLVKRPYCLQYNESDYDFFQRLLAEDGVAYYFEHQTERALLRYVDHNVAYPEAADTRLEYSKGNKPGVQIDSWERVYTQQTGSISINDYDQTRPAKSLLHKTDSASNFENNHLFESYYYPGYQADTTVSIAKTKLEAVEAACELIRLKSDCNSFSAGHTFELTKHDTATETGDYLLTRVHHYAKDTSVGTHDTQCQELESFYENTCTAQPADIVYRLPNQYPKPLIYGPQSAIVVGPEGEEIYTDKHNRIKVQFIWDRHGQQNENSSCFIRVAQSWAGNGWGTSFIPRIGHEVIVSFFNGDPDTPVVTGSLYNGRNTAIYESKTQSGIKTRSTKKGSAENYNELRFDDRAGEEQIYLHAEKNLDSRVENDETHSVDHNRTKIIGDNESSSVGIDRDEQVGQNHTETIGNDRDLTVANNESISIGNDQRISIGQDISISIGNNHAERIGNDMRVTVENNVTENFGQDQQTTVAKAHTLKAETITLTADKQVIIETGSASIKLSSNGNIDISGSKINIKGSGVVSINGQKTHIN